MARDINKESKLIRNGNRYVTEPHGTGVFPRDADRLFMQYENLRMSLYGKYSHRFKEQASKEELMSYINEQFIKLVKEYEVNGGVDFPGYVKIKLDMRVRNVFLYNYIRDKTRERLSKEPGEIEEFLSEDHFVSTDSDFIDLKQSLFNHVSLDSVEEAIVRMWLTPREFNDEEIIHKVSEQEQVSMDKVSEKMSGLKSFVKLKLPTV